MVRADRAAATGGSEGVEPFFPRLHPLVFAARGIVPVGSAAFAFVLGATLGVLLRRTLPAMALTLGVYVDARARRYAAVTSPSNPGVRAVSAP